MGDLLYKGGMMGIIDQLRDRLDSFYNTTKIGWDLKRNIKLFVNPEAKCPYCGRWFHTNRIWLVDDARNWLNGCWNLDGSPIASSLIIHPHAWMNGEVCIGKAESVSEALFAGVAQGKHIHHVPEWLLQMGHDCDEAPNIKCPICTKKFFNKGDYLFGPTLHPLCSKQCLGVADGFRCERCLSVIDRSQGRFCASCMEELYIPCSICSVKRYVNDMYPYSRNRLKCCSVCQYNLRTCTWCGYRELSEDMNEEGKCTACKDLIFCVNCSTNVEAVNEKGICNYCVNYCRECNCSPCECDDSWLEEIEEEHELEI
jgi:hypothetical protein